MVSRSNPDLDRRLLSAANLSYQIGVDEPPQDVAKRVRRYNALCGFSQIQTFVAGKEKDDAALIGVNETEIVLAFRGTLPLDFHSEDSLLASLTDWIHDFDADLVTDEGRDLPGWVTMPGEVHRGFLTALSGLWVVLYPALLVLRVAHPDKPLCITGHSKGGALANLAAMLCAPMFGAALYVCTFAAPRPGDTLFAEVYDRICPESLRYEYAYDIVPHLPPRVEVLQFCLKHRIFGDFLKLSERGYAPVGQPVPIAALTEDVAVEVDALESLMANLLSRAVSGKLGVLIDYHNGEIGYSYARALGLLEDEPSRIVTGL